ncbi:MAG: phytanoyl-CoA dioxygenase family protein [Gammaproteobacteria bacterium]
MSQALLSSDEIARYQRDGQLTPRWRLPADMVTQMQDSLNRLIAARPDLKPDFIPLPHTPWDDGASVSIAREFFAYVTHPDLLSLVSQLIGPDIILWASAVFCKPAATGLEVPWHQDGQYWPIRPRATVTVWIALDDVNADNGCMRVIPGSHRMGDFSHEVSDREDLVLNNVVNDPRLDLDTVIDVTLEPGQFSVHDVNIVHGSAPNRSGRRRAGYAIRYMPSTSHYDRSIDMGKVSELSALDFARRPIWLLRGVDRCGRNDFQVGHTAW